MFLRRGMLNKGMLKAYFSFILPLFPELYRSHIDLTRGPPGSSKQRVKTDFILFYLTGKAVTPILSGSAHTAVALVMRSITSCLATANSSMNTRAKASPTHRSMHTRSKSIVVNFLHYFANP